MTLPWIVGSAAVGALAGPPLRAIIAQYATPSPAPALRPRPLIVEVTTALLFGALAARVHPGLVLAAACWFAACAVPLAFIDIAVRRLPDPLTGAALAGTLSLLAAAALTAGHPGDLAKAVIGAVALPAFYLLLFLIRPSGMGLGDIKLAASAGAALGWLGWQQEVAATFATFTAAALYAIALLAARRATRTTQFPLGPFIIAGTLLVLIA